MAASCRCPVVADPRETAGRFLQLAAWSRRSAYADQGFLGVSTIGIDRRGIPIVPVGRAPGFAAAVRLVGRDRRDGALTALVQRGPTFFASTLGVTIRCESAKSDFRYFGASLRLVP